jgi:serralysin
MVGSRPHSDAYGEQGGLGAFDIAALQALYGANDTTATGNTVYKLPTRKAPGTGWSCIWDAGGNDTINAAAAKIDVTLDLRAATLAYRDSHAGGFISQQSGIAGGYTIAHGVTIENAVGGSGDDALWGNSSANRLYGNAGRDMLRGLSGNDILVGGDGRDTLTGGAGEDRFVLNAAPGRRNVDTITDFKVKDDTVQLSRSIFTKLSKGELKHDAFAIGAKAHDPSDRIIYDRSTGALVYDGDGSGHGAAVRIALLDRNLKLTHHDFVVA